LAVAQPPVITTQPTNQVVLSGGLASFSVAASGPGPFSYQWQLDGTNIPNLIDTGAGTGASGDTGDGGQATNASFSLLHGVAVDPAGNFYVVEIAGQRVRRVDTNGIITTFAGGGPGIRNGFAGDGGYATNCGFSYPEGVAADPFGNIFITDTVAGFILKVDPAGIITKFGGNQYGSFPQNGAPAPTWA
jgi:streptogramin lyase